MLWTRRNKEEHRYYLLPGMGRSNRRRHRQFLIAGIIVGGVVSLVIGCIIYFMGRMY